MFTANCIESHGNIADLVWPDTRVLKVMRFSDLFTSSKKVSRVILS